MKKWIIWATTMVVMQVAHADTAWLTTRVLATKVMADPGQGGCLAKLAVNFQQQLPLCKADCVTFSCTGKFASKDIAYRMFDLAQMALALDHQVNLQISDLRMHNGFCFAKQIIVMNE